MLDRLARTVSVEGVIRRFHSYDFLLFADVHCLTSSPERVALSTGTQ
jgi:hypothetical protein